MKNFFKVLLSEKAQDKAMTIMAFVILVCAVTALVAHIIIGAGLMAVIVDGIFVFGGWNLFRYLYKESKSSVND